VCMCVCVCVWPAISFDLRYHEKCFDIRPTIHERERWVAAVSSETRTGYGSFTDHVCNLWSRTFNLRVYLFAVCLRSRIYGGRALVHACATNLPQAAFARVRRLATNNWVILHRVTAASARPDRAAVYDIWRPARSPEERHAWCSERVLDGVDRGQRCSECVYADPQRVYTVYWVCFVYTMQTCSPRHVHLRRSMHVTPKF